MDTAIAQQFHCEHVSITQTATNRWNFFFLKAAFWQTLRETELLNWAHSLWLVSFISFSIWLVDWSHWLWLLHAFNLLCRFRFYPSNVILNSVEGHRVSNVKRRYHLGNCCLNKQFQLKVLLLAFSFLSFQHLYALYCEPHDCVHDEALPLWAC